MAVLLESGGTGGGFAESALVSAPATATASYTSAVANVMLVALVLQEHYTFGGATPSVSVTNTAGPALTWTKIGTFTLSGASLGIITAYYALATSASAYTVAATCGTPSGPPGARLFVFGLSGASLSVPPRFASAGTSSTGSELTQAVSYVIGSGSDSLESQFIGAGLVEDAAFSAIAGNTIKSSSSFGGLKLLATAYTAPTLSPGTVSLGVTYAAGNGPWGMGLVEVYPIGSAQNKVIIKDDGVYRIKVVANGRLTAAGSGTTVINAKLIKNGVTGSPVMSLPIYPFTYATTVVDETILTLNNGDYLRLGLNCDGASATLTPGTSPSLRVIVERVG